VKYFHRSQLPPAEVLRAAAEFFGTRLTPVEEQARRRKFAGAIGQIAVSAQAEGGHYTLVTAETDQVGESEADKLAKRFLTVMHKQEQPNYRPIGAY
jgi:hypothetical protein